MSLEEIDDGRLVVLRGGDIERDGHADEDLHSTDALLVASLNGEQLARERRAGTKVGNSGGHVLYLTPGLRINMAPSTSFSATVGYPVVNDLNGDQSEPAYRFIGGLSYRF